VQHVFAVAVKIRTSDTGAAADANFVSAVGAAATGAPIYEQVKAAGMVPKSGRFDGGAVGEGNRRRLGLQTQAGSRVQFEQFDAAPVGTERKPEPTIRRMHDGRVCGVIIV